MKNINIKIIGVFILMVLVLGSCKKWIDVDKNINPDAPQNVPMGSILPAIQVNMGYNTIGGNDIARVTAMWLQYIHGIARQSQAEADYIFRDGDVNNQWNTNYAYTMMDIYQLRDKAAASNHFYFKGVADVLMANALGICTDVWGDIPYTQAFQGQKNLTPVFDTQQSIYETIQALLDEAITNLSVVGFTGTIDGDLMYGGDATLWLKAAYALKARYALHLSKVDGQAYTKALAALPQAFAANDEDLEFPFGTGTTEQNPLYQFMIERGDIVMHKTFIDMLNFRFDPRIARYATLAPDTNIYIGADWNDTGDGCSLPGDGVASTNSPVSFMTYVECLFIKSECLFQTGDEAGAKQALFDGLKASLEKWGVYNDIYYNAYVAAMTPVTGADLFKEIMMQKYIGLYYQAESFNDWRRTENVIGLVPNPREEAARHEIPRRYPYSTDEKNYNPNTPKVADIWQRVWWDAIVN